MMTASPGQLFVNTSARPKLRPLALPTEHGGWGILFEPLVLGMLVVPSLGGALLALAFVAAFLARQPLRLALQDLIRRKSYPRTRWCLAFTGAYALTALASLAGALAISGTAFLLPLAVAAPLGLVQLVYDARNRSRRLLPELTGAIAMSSSAAAIAVAGGASKNLALILAVLIAARSIPAIIYVRTLIQRAHGQTAASWPAITVHFAALAIALMSSSSLAIVAMSLLLGRAAWQLARPIPPAKTIGWTEIIWGIVTVALIATGQLAGM